MGNQTVGPVEARLLDRPEETPHLGIGVAQLLLSVLVHEGAELPETR